VIPGEHVRAGKHQIVHHNIDEGSIQQAGEYRVTHQKREDTRCEDKDRRPDERDEEMKGETKKRGTEPAGVCGAVQDSACDRLRDLDGCDPAESIKDNWIEDVQNGGQDRTRKDGLDYRPALVIWHAEF